MATATFPFDAIPQSARQTGLSDFGYRLYAELIGAKNRQTGMCNPKQATLAERLGKSLRTVARAMAELRAKGMVVPRRTVVGNRYELATPDQWQAGADGTSHVPSMARASCQKWHVGRGASIYEPDVFEPERSIVAAADTSVTSVRAAAAAFPSGECKPQKPTPPAEVLFHVKQEIPAPAGVREAAEQIAIELMAVHPEPGNLPGAIAAAATVLASRPGDLEATIATIRRSHAACRLKWADYGKGRFIPMLPKWFADGDWMHAPVDRKAVKRETWIERREREYQESNEKTYRMYAELGAWDILREYGSPEFVEEWRAKVQAVA